jgi:CHAD domain-containing protein
MTDHAETEYKLRATRPIETAAVDGALRELGVAWQASPTRLHSDLYLDDAHGSLRGAGIGLRLRRTATDRRLECKSGGAPIDGLFVRRELAADWPEEALPAAALALPPALRDHVEPFVLDRPLLPLVQLTTRRDVRRIGHSSDDPCEVAIDEVRATAGDRSVAFHEVEIEFQGQASDGHWLAAALQQALPLEPATDDKPSHALRALGQPTPAEALRSPELQAPISQVVAQLTRQHLLALRWAEVGVRLDRDADSVHRMRVAARRLRSVVRAFRDLWPDDAASRLLELLAAGSRELGAVRDLDVLLDNLGRGGSRLPAPLRPAAESVTAWIGGQRDAARDALQATLRHPDRLARQAEIERCLAAVDHGTPHAGAPAAVDAPRRIAHAANRVRKLLHALEAALPLGPLHELRIACKRLRYVAEQFAELPGLGYDKALARVIDLQQAAGAVCDHEAAQARLLEWLRPVAGASADGALAAAALGGLAAQHALAADKARKVVARAIRRLDRKRCWRAFAGDAGPDANLAK